MPPPPPRTSHRSCSSSSAEARLLLKSSSMSATYWLGLSAQAASWSALITMYPSVRPTRLGSAGFMMGWKRSLPATASSTSNICGAVACGRWAVSGGW